MKNNIKFDISEPLISFLDANKKPFWIVDKDFKLQYYNQIAKQSFHYFFHSEAKLYVNLADLLPEKIAKESFEHHLSILKGEEFMYYRPFIIENKINWVQIFKKPIYNPEREVVAAITLIEQAPIKDLIEVQKKIIFDNFKNTHIYGDYFIFHVNDLFKIQYTNDLVVDILDYDGKTLLNLPFFSLTDSNYNPNIKKEIDHNNFIQKEFSIKNKSDQYLEYNVIFLKSNDLVFGDGYWIFAKNISELKPITKQLLKINLVLKTLLKALPDTYLLINNNNKVVEFNYGNTKLLDNYINVIGQDFLQFFPETLHSVIKKRIYQVNSTNLMVQDEVEFLVNNQLFIYELRFLPLDFQIILLIRDVTENKNIIRNLTESENRFRNIFENAPIGLFLTNQKMDIIKYNRSFISLFSISNVSEMDLNLENYVDPDYWQNLVKQIQKVIEEDGTRLSSEIKLINQKTKAPIDALMVLSLTKNEQGILQYFTFQVIDISYRVRSELVLLNSLKEKETLLKEVHHRVKNNLQIVSSLLNLQTSKITDVSILENMEVTQKRIQSIALVHEMLYKSPDLSQINMLDYIEILSENITQVSGFGVYIKLDIDVPKDIFLDLERATPCGLILNELLTNAIKYAFEGKQVGIISIEMKQNQEKYYITVEDDGKGIDIKEVDKSVGLNLVKILSTQIDGDFKISNNIGAKFELTF